MFVHHLLLHLCADARYDSIRQCPGTELDTLFNGSKPIIAEVGRQTSTQVIEVEEVVEVVAVSTTLTLDQNAEEVDLDELKTRLALLYNVPVSSIRLGLSGGSVVLVLEIIAANSSESLALASAVSATTRATISSALGSVTVISSVQQVVRNETIRRNQTLELQLDCPVGYW